MASKKHIMRKLLFLALIALMGKIPAHAQTVANFFADTVCYGDSTTLVSASTSTGNILSVDWDMDSNGLFNDASGILVKWKFPQYKEYTVGIRVISDLPDTSVIYKKVITYPVPSADFDIDFPKQCVVGNLFTYTNQSTIASGTMTYFWDLDEGMTSSAKDTSVTYSIAGVKNVMLIATSDHGCVDTAIKAPEVISFTIADFLINDSIQCLNENMFYLTDQSINCGTVLEYAWDLDNDKKFNDSVGDFMVAVKFSAPGTYQVGFRIKTTAGDDSLYKTVYVLPSPSAGFKANKDYQCFYENNFNLINTSFIASGTMNYFWDMGNGDTFSTVDISNYSYGSEGNFDVQLIAVTDKGCPDTAVQTLQVLPSPIAGISSSDTIICLGDTVFLTNTSTISSGWNLTYFWDMDDGTGTFSPWGKDTQYIYTSAGYYAPSLVAQSDSNCTDTFWLDILVINQSKAIISVNDTDQCLDNNLFVFSNASVTCSPLTSISWDLNNDGIFGDTNVSSFNYSYNAPGMYRIGLKIVTTTDSSITYQNVYVSPQPQASFNINDSIQNLAGNLFVFTNTSSISSGSLSYIWYIDTLDTAFAVDTSYSFTNPGTYPVKLMAMSDKGCKDSITKYVYVTLPINAGFRYTVVCFGDSTYLEDTTTSSDPILSHEWDLDGDGIFGDTTGKVLRIPAPYPGSFLVGLKVITTKGFAIVYDTIDVLPRPKADFTYQKACQGMPVIFMDKSDSQGSIIKKYYWDFDNDNVIDDSSGTKVSHIFSSTTAQNTALTVVSDNGCSDKIVKSVSFLSAPTADFGYTNACAGDSVYFINKSTIGSGDSIINYHWDYGDGKDAIIRKNHKHFYATSGSYKVILTALSSNGCEDTTSHLVTIHNNPTPTLSFSGDTIIYEGQSVTISLTSSYDSIFWSTGETQTQSITVNKTGIYTVRVVNSFGCDAIRSTQVIVNPVPEIKAIELFTPNGDGVNDRFIIDKLDAFKPVTLTIYNRYGDEIYSSNDYQNDWDGKYKGKYLPEGTYYYIIKTGDGKVIKGTVNIIK